MRHLDVHVPLWRQAYAVSLKLWSIDADSPADEVCSLVDLLDSTLLGRVAEECWFPRPYGAAVLFEQLAECLEAVPEMLRALDAVAATASVGISYGLLERVYGVHAWSHAAIPLNVAARLASMADLQGLVAVDPKVRADMLRANASYQDLLGNEQTRNIKEADFRFHVLASPFRQAGREQQTRQRLPANPPRRVTSANIVSFDIEKFSRREQSEQVQLNNNLCHHVEEMLAGVGGTVESWTPAGDGGQVVFLSRAESSAAQAWNFARSLQEAAVASRVPLRIGIENGPVLASTHRPAVGGALLRADEISSLVTAGGIAVSKDFWAELPDRFKSGLQPTPAACDDRVLLPFTSPVTVHLQDDFPVDPWKPAVPPVFVGRRLLLTKMRNAWDQGRSVSLVGDWRIGKSSVLATCYEVIGRSGRPVRFLNGESREGSSPAEFVRAATGVASSADPDSAADVLAAWASRERRPGLLPLLLVDECDALVRRFEYRFFERLRGMLDQLCLGISSRRELDRVFQDVGRGASPFQNRLELYWVGLLEHEAAGVLVSLTSAGLASEAQSQIVEWAGRHPFFIQLLARKLRDATKYGQQPAEAMEEFETEASARLRELWSTLSDNDRHLLNETLLEPKPAAMGLRRRGLLDETGRPFGRVLVEWLRNEAN